MFGIRQAQEIALGDPAARHQRRLARMRRVVPAAATAIQTHMQRRGARYRCAMVTTTYRPGADWTPRDISRLCDHYRQWLRRRGARLRAVWVIELQKRGAPHYHLLLWLPRGLTPPMPDKRGWWPHGSTRCEWARRPVHYLAKYASKGDPHTGALPKGARLYGVYGAPIALDWWRAGAWQRAIARAGDTIRRGVDGWHLFPDQALALRSPWAAIRAGPNRLLLEWRGWPPTAVLDLWLYERTHGTPAGA